MQNGWMTFKIKKLRNAPMARFNLHVKFYTWNPLNVLAISLKVLHVFLFSFNFCLKIDVSFLWVQRVPNLEYTKSDSGDVARFWKVYAQIEIMEKRLCFVEPIRRPPDSWWITVFFHSPQNFLNCSVDQSPLFSSRPVIYLSHKSFASGDD